MGCPINANAKTKEYLMNGGMSESEADKEIATFLTTPEDIQSGKVDDNTLKNVVTMNTYGDLKSAATQQITETWDVEKVIESGLQTDTEIASAYSKKGIDIKTIATVLHGREWTDIPFSDGKTKEETMKNANDFATLVVAGHPDAVKFVNSITNAALAGDKNSQDMLIVLWDFMGTGGMTEKFGTKKPAGVIENYEKATTEIYNKYYDNIYNVDQSEHPLSIESGNIIWTDGMGSKHKATMTEIGGEAVYNPKTNKMETLNDEYIQQTIQINQYTKLSLNSDEYAKAVLEYMTRLQDIPIGDEEKQKLLWDSFGEAVMPNVENPGANTGMWACTGSGCLAATGEGSGGGGGGGGGGSSGGSSYTAKTENVLYIECNVSNASIWDKGTGKTIGNANTSITLPVGTYTIQVKATGYKTREMAIEIGSYPVSKTINLTLIGPSISTFIKGIGGIQNLSKTKYLYLFCMWKMRITSLYTWKQFADTIDTVESSAFPTIITTNDVLYVYFLVNGDISSAQALVDAGKVTLLEEEGGNEIEIEHSDMGTTGGGI